MLAVCQLIESAEGLFSGNLSVNNRLSEEKIERERDRERKERGREDI